MMFPILLTISTKERVSRRWAVVRKAVMLSQVVSVVKTDFLFG